MRFGWYSVRLQPDHGSDRAPSQATASGLQAPAFGLPAVLASVVRDPCFEHLAGFAPVDALSNQGRTEETRDACNHPDLTDADNRAERALSVVTDIRAGEGATVVLMLANIFLLLVCYSVIKTVRSRNPPRRGRRGPVLRRGRPGTLLMGFVPALRLVCHPRRPRQAARRRHALFIVASSLRLGRCGAGAVRGGRLLHLGGHLQRRWRRSSGRSPTTSP